jgi:D-tyrosyl-tRNA(Tyr) deacylase
MKAVLQRCRSAQVSVDGANVAQIGPGLAVFLGIAGTDDEAKAARLAAKIAGLRIFNDEAGRFNLSVQQVGGSILLISNFTLYGDARKGNRPSFGAAAPAETALPLYERFATLLSNQGLPVHCGVFGADMRVTVENDGPVTLIVEID